MNVCKAKTQISLGICSVWSESLQISQGIRSVWSESLKISQGIRSVWSESLQISQGIRSVWSESLQISQGIRSVWSESLQISQGIRSVWSESLQISQGIRSVWSVFADQPGHPPSLTRVFTVYSVGNYKDPSFLYVDREDSAQTELMPIGWSESSHDAQPHCWFPHVAANVHGPRQKKTCLQGLVNNKGAHPHRLISTFVIHLLESIIYTLVASKI